MRKAWISQFQTFKQQEVRFAALHSQHFISSVESKVKIVVGIFCFHTHTLTHRHCSSLQVFLPQTQSK